MKNKLKKRIISAVLCSVLLLGSVMLVQADTPICGGNHSFGNVREVGIKRFKDVGTHLHDGQYCIIYAYYKVYLQRCACGAEQTWTDESTVYTAHTVN